MSDLVQHLDPELLREVARMHGVPEPEIDDPLAKARRKRAEEAHKRSTTIAEMMKVAEIRAVIHGWLDACGAFRMHDFPSGPCDFGVLARLAAHREVAQLITRDLLAACPDLYLVMLRENQRDG